MYFGWYFDSSSVTYNFWNGPSLIKFCKWIFLFHRYDTEILGSERERLMKKLIETEMDGQAAVKQIGELRDALRRLREVHTFIVEVLILIGC